MGDTNKSGESGKSPWFKIRMTILGLMLVAVAAALVFDWFVQKPAMSKKLQKVDEMFSESRGLKKIDGPRPAYTPEDVEEAIGRKASTERFCTDEKDVKILTYEWRRGLPIQLVFEDDEEEGTDDKDQTTADLDKPTFQVGPVGVKSFPKYFFEAVYKKEKFQPDPNDEKKWKERFVLYKISGENTRVTYSPIGKMDIPKNPPKELLMPAAPGAPGPRGGGKGKKGSKKGKDKKSRPDKDDEGSDKKDDADSKKEESKSEDKKEESDDKKEESKSEEKKDDSDDKKEESKSEEKKDDGDKKEESKEDKKEDKKS